jgi:hypothetical protein
VRPCQFSPIQSFQQLKRATGTAKYLKIRARQVSQRVRVRVLRKSTKSHSGTVGNSLNRSKNASKTLQKRDPEEPRSDLYSHPPADCRKPVERRVVLQKRKSRTLERALAGAGTGAIHPEGKHVQSTVAPPQHRLYFFPEPHGQGSFRPTLAAVRGGGVKAVPRRLPAAPGNTCTRSEAQPPCVITSARCQSAWGTSPGLRRPWRDE